MTILVDECTPRLVKTALGHLSIRTVQEMGWSGVKNGALLRLAEAQFDVLVSSDQSLRHQQNLAGRRVALVVLPSNQVPIVRALLPAITQAIQQATPGSYVDLDLP